MKIEILVVISAMIALTEASISPWLVMPLVLSMNGQVEGFFNIFRRRQPPKMKSPEIKPEQPIRFSPSIFPSQGGMNFFNPFGNGPFSGFQNAPSFAGGFASPGFAGGPFRPRPPQQSWFPPNAPSQPLMQQPSIGSESNFETGQGFDSQQNMESGQMFGSDGHNFDSDGFDRDTRLDDQPPAINTEEAESFFTLLAETDENKCISRLVCEMGADPSNAGELGTTVSDIVGSLTDFPPGTKVFEYNEILRKGRLEGMTACLSEYSTCDEETYKLMRSNAPDDAEAAEGAN